MNDPTIDLQWIIPCCSRKSPDGDLEQEGIASSNKRGFSQLEPFRSSLIESLTCKFDSWECAPNNVRLQAAEDNSQIQNGRSFPALDRYDGNLYQELTEKALQSILNRTEKFEFLILSALYGLLRPEDGIAYYNLMIGDRCGDSRVMEQFQSNMTRAKVYALWKKVAPGLLGQSLQSTSRVYCLLSGNKYMGYQSVVYAWRQVLGLKGYRIIVNNGNSAITSPTHGKFLNYCLVNEISAHADILSIATKFDCRVERVW